MWSSPSPSPARRKNSPTCCSYAKRYSIPLLGMTAKADSTLGRAADILLQVPDAAEACAETNAPTTSTTLMMALGDALAVALLESKGFKADHFKVFHPGGKLGAMLRTAGDVMHKSTELPLVASRHALHRRREDDDGQGLRRARRHQSGRHARRPRHRRRPPPLSSPRARPAATIDDVMTQVAAHRRACSLAADVLRTMNERKITQMFVVDGGKPVGLIHMHDLLKAGLRVKSVIVIPARYASTRFPGKPLHLINGVSMLARTVAAARKAGQATGARVLVATDDDRIANHAREIGAEPVMTDPDLPSGTDRCRAADGDRRARSRLHRQPAGRRALHAARATSPP